MDALVSRIWRLTPGVKKRKPATQWSPRNGVPEFRRHSWSAPEIKREYKNKNSCRLLGYISLCYCHSYLICWDIFNLELSRENLIGLWYFAWVYDLCVSTWLHASHASNFSRAGRASQARV